MQLSCLKACQGWTDLWRHLCEQVVVGSKRTQIYTLTDGGRQRLDLIEATVQLIQSRESTDKDPHVIQLLTYNQAQQFSI